WCEGAIDLIDVILDAPAKPLGVTRAQGHQRHHAGQIPAAEDHGTSHVGLALDGALDVFRLELDAPLRDDDVLLAALDVEVAVRVHAADVAGGDASLAQEGLALFFGVDVEIAVAEQIRVVEDDFAVLGQFERAGVDLLADRSELDA